MYERSFFAGACLSVAALVACGQSPVGSADTHDDAPEHDPTAPKSADGEGDFDDEQAGEATRKRPASRGAADAASPRARDGGTTHDATTAADGTRGSAADASPFGVDATAPSAPGPSGPSGAPPTVIAVNHQSINSGACHVPADAQLEDSSRPTSVVGNGTPGSCTGSAFVAAVARGGVITFDCGPNPHTITLDQTAKVLNSSRKVVIDGGGKVTLSGGGRVRILYQNTCDAAQGFATSHCDNQETPQLTVQNLTFVDGSARGSDEGGGAIFAQGGRLKVLNSHFFNNVCADVGPDVGGGAIRAMMQHNNQTVYVVNSTFGGQDGRGNVCSNGGALSSIGVSYTVIGSVLSYNRAIGHGANPPQAGTPGGGSGGAIYNDGTSFDLRVCGTNIEHNRANEGGGGIFFVSNDQSGSLAIESSTLADNPSGKFENFPGMFVIARGNPSIANTQVR